MERAAFSPNITLDASGRLDQDLTCIECGYNLRGLEPASQCPECGRSIDESMRQNLLRYADGWWLRRVAIGARMAFHGALWLTALPFVVMLLGLILDPLLRQNVFGDLSDAILPLLPLVPIALAGTILTGLWLVSEPDPLSLQMSQPRPLSSRIARPAVITAGALWSTGFSMYFGARPWLPILAIFTSLIAWSACSAVMSGLAKRVPLLPLSRQFAIATRMVIWLGIAAGIFACILTLVEGLPVSITGLQVVLPVFALGVVLAWFVLNIWYLVLLGKLCRHISAVVRETASQASAQPVGELSLFAESPLWTQEVIRSLWWTMAAMAVYLLLGLVSYLPLIQYVESLDFYGTRHMARRAWMLLHALQSLTGLAAICGVLRATAVPPGVALARQQHRLRRTGRTLLTLCGLLTILGSLDRYVSLSEGRILIILVVALLAVAGWTAFVAYLASLARELKNDRLAGWMRLAARTVLFAGVLWFCIDVGWGTVLRLATSLWPSSPERQPLYPFVSLASPALWLIWHLSLLVPAGLMYRALRRQERNVAIMQPKTDPLSPEPPRIS